MLSDTLAENENCTISEITNEVVQDSVGATKLM